MWHPAGVQCGTRCASGLCAMGARLRPGSSYSMRGWLRTEPFRRQLRLGPGGNIARHRWCEMRLTVQIEFCNLCRQVMVCTVPLGLSVDRVGGWAQKSEG